MRTGWGIFLIGLGLLPGLAAASAAPAQLRAAVFGAALDRGRAAPFSLPAELDSMLDIVLRGLLAGPGGLKS
jgi:hypothetical protein